MEYYKFDWIDNKNELLRYLCTLQDSTHKLVCNGKMHNDNKKLDLRPSFGKTVVEYKSHKIKIKYTQYPDVQALSHITTKHEELSIYIMAANLNQAKKILLDLVNDVEIYSVNRDSESITVKMYTPTFGWSNYNNLKKRGLDTIYINEVKKGKLIEDIKKFYSSEQRYQEFGIPYKRVYLFAGPPGTGKTSFIFSIASLLNKNLAIVCFNQKLDDSSFMNCVRTIGDDSILLLEDVDSLFVNRDVSNNNISSITFSGVLNILDGICRKDNLVIFMTTNHIDKLDDALKRAGRVDYIMKFTHLKKGQIKQMFCKFLPHQTDKFDTFYDHIEGKEIYPALLQQFLFNNIDCDNIINKIPELVELIKSYEKLRHNFYT
jgi:chaperone BCS1